MPKIEAFSGLRYDLGHVGSLSNVVAPPYDVIDPEMQHALYERHPANVVRLILNRAEADDNEESNCYSRAAMMLRNWQREGILFRESDPAVYVYHQVFDDCGNSIERRGFMARCGLERFGEGTIYPHEETMSGPKADRLKLTRACEANLSQIFGLYPDGNSEAQDLLETAIAGVAPLEATDDLGVIHRIWPVTDLEVLTQLAAIMGPKPMFIADGHHRYETACNYRDELEAEGKLAADDAANGVLMMCVGMNDPGLIVQPTHRLFRGVPELSAEQLGERLAGYFTTRIAGEGVDLAEPIWEEIEKENDQGTIGLLTTSDERWTVARITDQGRERMAELVPDHSSDWQGLGVSILHRLIIDDLLGAAGHPKPGYVHSVEKFMLGIEQNSEPGGAGEVAEPYRLGALVMPASLEHIRKISEHGERMPAKSTYFYPKLLAGMVIHSHK